MSLPEAKTGIGGRTKGPPAVGRPPSLKQRLRHPVEGFAVGCLLKLFAALPLDMASGLGALIGGTIGAVLPVNKTARNNLSRAFPEMSEAELRRTLRAMWRHLGRVFAEYPHLAALGSRRLEILGSKHLDALKRTGGPAIFFTGHVGNWEVCPIGPTQAGIPTAAIYRAPNNPVVHRLLWRVRDAVFAQQVPKGSHGARQIVSILRGRGFLLLVVDQKMNNGIAVPFFGRDAMTAPALAEMALKYDCPIYPLRAERLKGTHMRLTVGGPLAIPAEGTRQEKVHAIMSTVNGMLEGWIRERPEQWLWSHNRWPD